MNKRAYIILQKLSQRGFGVTLSGPCVRNPRLKFEKFLDVLRPRVKIDVVLLHAEKTKRIYHLQKEMELGMFRNIEKL